MGPRPGRTSRARLPELRLTYRSTSTAPRAAVPGDIGRCDAVDAAHAALILEGVILNAPRWPLGVDRCVDQSMRVCALVPCCLHGRGADATEHPKAAYSRCWLQLDSSGVAFALCASLRLGPYGSA